VHPEPPHNLFVYGTLRRGLPNQFARLLAQQETWLGRARIQGRLYRLDRYPGLTLSSAPEEWAIGEVYRLHDAQRTLAILDDYEGCGPLNPLPHEYARVTATVLLETGTPVPVWVYVYNWPVAEERRILSGDWL
jgi:gamma-glutamylcyclotransferase (GGCT)/AIG2-like uncharacterized protein YtfP